MRALFSDRVIDQTSPVWGTDEEGEVRGCYRASGHPGVCAHHLPLNPTKNPNNKLFSSGLLPVILPSHGSTRSRWCVLFSMDINTFNLSLGAGDQGNSIGFVQRIVHCCLNLLEDVDDLSTQFDISSVSGCCQFLTRSST